MKSPAHPMMNKQKDHFPDVGKTMPTAQQLLEYNLWLYGRDIPFPIAACQFYITGYFEYQEMKASKHSSISDTQYFNKEALENAYIQGYRKRSQMSELIYDHISALNAVKEFNNWFDNLYGHTSSKQTKEVCEYCVNGFTLDARANKQICDKCQGEGFITKEETK